MNIGIDIDGTLSRYYPFFLELATAFKERGHKVYIITGLGQPKAGERAAQYPIPNDGLFCSADYNQFEIQMINHLSRSAQEAHNEVVVGAFKQRICAALEIDIMFDDKADIHQWFGKTPVFKAPKL